MITLIPTTLSGTTPSVYGVEIKEMLCGGYQTDNMPTVSISVANNGNQIASGGVTLQKMTFIVEITYQPCNRSSNAKTKTYAETAIVALPGGSLTSITPTISATAATVVATNKSCCGNRANGVKILTSVSVAFN